MLRKIALVTLGLIHSNVFGQCSMCRATLENNLSNGEAGLAAGMNFGILYLFVMPYLLVAIVAYLWYRKSRAQLQNERRIERIKQKVRKAGN